jgi:hypothetical protein
MEDMNFYPDDTEPGPHIPDFESAAEAVFGDGYRAPDVVPTDDRIPTDYEALSVSFLIEPTADTRRTLGELAAAVREQGEPMVDHSRFVNTAFGDHVNDPDYATAMCSTRGVSEPNAMNKTECLIEAAVWHRTEDSEGPRIRGRGYIHGEMFGELSHADYLATLDRLALRIDGAEHAWLQEVLRFSQLPRDNPHRTLAANLVIDAAPVSIPVHEATFYSLSKIAYNNGALIAHDWEESNENFKRLTAQDLQYAERLLIRLPAGDTVHYMMGRGMSEYLFVMTRGDTPQDDVPTGLPTFGPGERRKMREHREAGVLTPTDGGMAALIAQVRAALDSGVQQSE